MSAATKLLDRLELVKQTGPDRWIARCPVHEDKSPSLSIREADGGRLLVYDFGGCEIGDILTAVGLTLSDLFEKPLAGSGSAGGYVKSHSRIPARDLLEIVSQELSLVAIIVCEWLDRRSVTEADWKRFATAAARIQRARDHIHG